MTQQVKSLQDFLVEAELDHYHENFKKDLKVHTVPHIKYVDDKDLQEIGMTKPEIRRLRKFFRKEFPQGALHKLKKILVTSGGSGPQTSVDGQDANNRTESYLTPTPTDAISNPLVSRSPGKHIIPEDSIEIVQTIGTGEFGNVEEGIWTNESGRKVKVAIKCLIRDQMETGVGDFMKEAAIMHSLQHDHLVTLYGVVLAPDKLMLISELAPDKSLLECLRTAPDDFSVFKLCTLAVQVCDAMAYLERRRLIHRDLAARNLLMYSKDCVKIADFGLSRALTDEKDFYQTEYKPTLRLPLAWCAPECINYLKFTSASDVWAFGVTMWEMFTFGDQPWAGLTGQEKNGTHVIRSSDMQLAQEILDAIDEPHCDRLPMPERCPRAMYQQMLRCWEHEPDRRPHFDELLHTLPSLKPELVQARESSLAEPDTDYLSFNQGDVITVLDKSPPNPPEANLWHGVSTTGQTGFFNPSQTMVYMEVKAIAGPVLKKSPANNSSQPSSSSQTLKEKIIRKVPSRRHSARQRLDISMISAPQSDFRHTAHIGYDGAQFGDLSFMGKTGKLPLQLPTKKAPGSVGSLSNDSEPHGLKSSRSETQLLDSGVVPVNMSASMYPSSNGHSTATEKYEDIEDSLESFKLPDFSSDFDTGASLFDEIFSSLSVTKDFDLNSASPQQPANDDRSPLIEKDINIVNGNSSFDNVALVANDKKISVDRQPSLGTESTDSVTNSASGSPPSSAQPIEEKTGWRPKLKIEAEDSEDEDDEELIKGKPRTGMRTLSQSEEKEFNEAVELANEFAQRSQSTTPSPKPVQSPADSRHKTFSFLSSKREAQRENSKDKEPPPRSYTEEIQRIRSVEPEVSETAQEVYDALITKGGVLDRGLRSGSREQPFRSGRSWRSVDQAGLDSSGGSSSSVGFTSQRTQQRAVNLNIREPQGIPSRKPSASDDASNPLRRLRDGSALVQPVRSLRKPPALPPDVPPVSPTPVKLATPEKSSPEQADSGDELSSEGRLIKMFAMRSD